jgi:hypothetical protein
MKDVAQSARAILCKRDAAQAMPRRNSSLSPLLLATDHRRRIAKQTGVSRIGEIEAFWWRWVVRNLDLQCCKPAAVVLAHGKEQQSEWRVSVWRFCERLPTGRRCLSPSVSVIWNDGDSTVISRRGDDTDA